MSAGVIEIDKDIIVEMIYEYFINKNIVPEHTFRKYSIEYSHIYANTDQKLSICYRIKYRETDNWTTQLVGLSKREYLNRLAREKSWERERKINQVLG